MAHRYDPVGRCIYCGATGRLTDEHIIPLALGGDFILPQASCRACAHRINKDIENPILNNEMKAFRTFQRLPTRRPKQRPKTHDLVNRDGTVIQIPASEYYGPHLLYKYMQPRILSGAEPVPNGDAFTVDVFGTNEAAEMALRDKYPHWDQTHQFKVEPLRFTRLLAKIGYSYAIAEVGLDAFLPGDVIDIVLGRSKDYFRCIGGTKPEIHPGPEEEPTGHWFRIQLLSQQRGVGSVLLVIVAVRFFAKYKMPTYSVVVGEVDLKNPRHSHAMEKHLLNGQLEWPPNAPPSPAAALMEARATGGRPGRK